MKSEYIFNSQEWSLFHGLLSSFKDDFTDIIIQKNKISLYNDTNTGLYIVYPVIPSFDENFNLTLNSIRQLVPIFDIFKGSDEIRLVVDPSLKQYVVSDDMTKISIRYTDTIYNIKADNSFFSHIEEFKDLSFSLPSKLFGRVITISENFKTPEIIMKQDVSSLKFRIESNAKYRHGEITLRNSITKRVLDEIFGSSNKDETVFSVIPFITIYSINPEQDLMIDIIKKRDGTDDNGKMLLKLSTESLERKFSVFVFQTLRGMFETF